MSTLSAKLDANSSVVTIGTYDGVHLGHRQLIAETMRQARARGVRSRVVTFAVHPLTVLRPDLPIRLLCTTRERIALLQATGVDDVVVLGFDEARVHEPAEEFVKRELVDELGATFIVVGANFRFGHERRGDVAMLSALGSELGFGVEGVELVLDDAQASVVSSTRIRAHIREGELDIAAHLLGRRYHLPAQLHSNGEITVADDLLIPGAGRYLVNVSDSSGDGAVAIAVADPEGNLRLEGLTGEGEIDLTFLADRGRSGASDR
jgi:riboflavin kinase/FMN adenylyltransferase